MDNLTSAQRSYTMRAVKSVGSAAELEVRRMCRELGYPGYRLHRRDIAGTPDLAYLGRRLAVFVHGCFWHGHSCRAGTKIVKTNAAYWHKKIDRNVARDELAINVLRDAGWKVLVIWECELKNKASAKASLARFLASGGGGACGPVALSL
jgi:DNA mismatch endonuclease, patch repair protein